MPFPQSSEMSATQPRQLRPVITSEGLPNLIIGGVNKAATTSLYTYLARHPQICASSIKEIHYFMPLVTGGLLEPLETYASHFKHYRAQQYRLEASPRYMFGGAKIAKAISETLPEIKIIFMLREPSDRLVSYFRHMKNDGRLPTTMSCEEYAQKALQELPRALARANRRPIAVYQESIFVRGLAQGFYSDYLEEWYSVFPNSIRVCFFEELKSDPQSVLQSLFEWLALDPEVYLNSEFSQENRTMTHRNASFYAIAGHLNTRFEPFWRRHHGVKKLARSVYCWLNEQPSRADEISGQCRAELQCVYSPYNKRLAETLFVKGYSNFPAWV